jgi:mono/diheme cytochrome c family protein
MKNAPLTRLSPARAKRLAAALVAASALFALPLLSACRSQQSVVAESAASNAAAAATPAAAAAAAAPGTSPTSPAPVGPSGLSPVPPSSGLSMQQGQAGQAATPAPDQTKREMPQSMLGSDPKKVEEFMKNFKPTPTPPPAPTPKVEVVNGKIKQQWEAPAEFANLPNPVKDKPGTAKLGRELYMERCEICHGKLGRGDGPWARNFSKVPTNLSSKVVQANTDGELFYKVTNARNPHPASKVAFTDEQRWHIVSFLRTLK